MSMAFTVCTARSTPRCFDDNVGCTSCGWSKTHSSNAQIPRLAFRTIIRNIYFWSPNGGMVSNRTFDTMSCELRMTIEHKGNSRETRSMVISQHYDRMRTACVINQHYDKAVLTRNTLHNSGFALTSPVVPLKTSDFTVNIA